MILLMGISFVANSRQPESSDSLVYDISVVDEKPEFPGGIEGIMRYLSQNLKYSTSCYQPEGRVVAKFIIDADGYIKDVEIIQSIDPDYLDNEVVRVVKEMPRWNPGKLNDKTVDTWFMLPINFRNSFR